MLKKCTTAIKINIYSTSETSFRRQRRLTRYMKIFSPSSRRDIHFTLERQYNCFYVQVHFYSRYVLSAFTEDTHLYKLKPSECMFTAFEKKKSIQILICN